MTEPPPDTAGPQDEGPLTTVIRRDVVPGSEPAFDEWLQGVIAASSQFAGHEGVTVLRPGESGPRTYVLVVRWRDYESYRRWETSSERAAWLEKVRPLTANDPVLWSKTGLETWFTLPGEPVRTGPPPAAKMAVLTFAGIYPLIVALLYALTPVLGLLPIPLRALTMSAILIPTMTWIVMPRLTRLAWSWLYPGVPRS